MIYSRYKLHMEQQVTRCQLYLNESVTR